jgi:hypothetical protein
MLGCVVIREEETMSYAREILETHPRVPDIEAGVLADALNALKDCAQACVADVDADLAEPNVTDMVKCIRLCLDCNDVCTASAGVLSRPTDLQVRVTKPLLEACVSVCKSCGDECERHAQMHDHCRICAEACRRCEKACRQLLTVIG